MTTTIVSADLASATEAPARKPGFLATVVQELSRALSATATHADLDRRSDAALRDVGLSRQDVASEVRRQHYA